MSKIEWTDRSWNPVTGCTKVSPGCENCYAERMARRFAGRNGYPSFPHHFDVTFHPERLGRLGRGRKKKKVFVCSMSDLFHGKVTDLFRHQVFEHIIDIPNIYQILTKRALWMRDYICRCLPHFAEDFPNVWLGVSIENPDYLGRLDDLKATPAAVRFVSFEPLLAPLPDLDLTDIDWVIVGAESGPDDVRRPFDPAWALDIYEQCRVAGVPFFGKQDSGTRPGVPLVLPGTGEVKEWPA